MSSILRTEYLHVEIHKYDMYIYRCVYIGIYIYIYTHADIHL